MEVQADYLKSAYEGFVAQSAKVGQLYADLAQELYKPLESSVGQGDREVIRAAAARNRKPGRKAGLLYFCRTIRRCAFVLRDNWPW